MATTLVGASAVGTSGRVIALEPDPAKFVRLLHNISLNQATNTLCFPVAASDETIHATLFCEIPQGPQMSAGRSIRVQRVDTLCKRLGCDSVRLVKIDAPGSEHLVLRGMSNLLAAAAAPRVLCHVSKWSPQFANEERENLINFMADYGYVPTQLGPTQTMRAPGLAPQVRFTLLFDKP